MALIQTSNSQEPTRRRYSHAWTRRWRSRWWKSHGRKCRWPQHNAGEALCTPCIDQLMLDVSCRLYNTCSYLLRSWYTSRGYAFVCAWNRSCLTCRWCNFYFSTVGYCFKIPLKHCFQNIVTFMLVWNASLGLVRPHTQCSVNDDILSLHRMKRMMRTKTGYRVEELAK